MAECLRNNVVLRKILEHFSNSELLRLSFVNKLWNYEARSVMKNRGNLIASLKFLLYRPCQEYLDAFAADLHRMNVIPFSGLGIHLGHFDSTCQGAVLHSTYANLLDKLRLKSVTVQLIGNWCKNKVCPGSLLARKVLEHFNDVLEEVSLAQFSYREGILIAGFVKDFNFPRLKILKVGEYYYGENGPRLATTLKALVAGAPTLEELHTPGPINLVLDVLEGRSAFLVYQSDVFAPFEEIPDIYINAIRIEKIKLCYMGPRFNMERFNRIAPVLLQGSCLAIKSMEIDPFLAVPLMCYGISFENVRHLTMSINPSQMEVDEPRILRILKRFDFSRIFPNLKAITITPRYVDPQLSVDHVNGFVEQANASLKEPAPDRAINIKELDIMASTWSTVDLYAEIFPHIERLRVRLRDGVAFLGSVWKHWVNLEKLYVLAAVQKHFDDLDSVICGIFPEEVAELRRKDEEFLKKVNIVPVMPAITCLRNLREFTITLTPISIPPLGYPSPNHVELVSPSILSKVTGLIAFARCPKLQVFITTQDLHVYEALRSYASVLYIKPDMV